MRFLLAHFLSLCRSFWVVCCSVVSCIHQFDVICKLDDDALDPTVCVIDKDIERHQSQDRALRDAIHHIQQFTTTPLCPSSQLLIHRIVNLSNPCVCNLGLRMSLGITSKALQKYR